MKKQFKEVIAKLEDIGKFDLANDLREVLSDLRDFIIKEKVLYIMKLGDVYKTLDTRAQQQIITIVVVDNTGFYYYLSKENGKPIKSGVYHSNLLRKRLFKKINHIKFNKHIKLKGFEWVNTGNKEIDTKLSQLDQRYDFFMKFATPDLVKHFKDQEARNYHLKNFEMINDFALWISKGKKPEDFNV